ncbi:MAG: CoA-binding protein, partial [Humidesulfovibrio sp.]|nr:CoA-binding protein [Humidesulfovibrio sp.]
MPQQPLDLTPLFEPAAVAVVGASRSQAKVGGMLLANLLGAGYRGRVHPVNPEAALQCKDIMGLPAVASAAELPDGLDLAVLCLPREQVLGEMRILADKGVRAAIVLAAGFRETGRLGFEAEMELKRIATAAGMVLLGPNSLGLISTSCGLNASFAIGQPKPGGVAFFSQSGAMCVAVLDWAMGLNMGFSRFVSLGNKALLDESAVLRYLGADPETRVILGYCESVEDGDEFMAAAAEVSAHKPVLMLKAGSTAAGARAVSAHTGAISGSPAAYRAAFRQSGVLQVDESAQLFGLAQAFATQPLPSGPGLAILTNSGGPGILAADACAGSSLTLPRPSTETLARLTEILPSFASAYNPVDILGDAGPERYRAALTALLADAQTHAVLVLLTPTAQARAEATARTIIEAAQGPENAGPDGKPKPVAACFMGREAVR